MNLSLTLAIASLFPAAPQMEPGPKPALELKELAFLIGRFRSDVEFYNLKGDVVREATGEEFGLINGFEMKPVLGERFLEGGADTTVARTWIGYLPREETYFWTSIDFQGNFDVMHGDFDDRGRLQFTMINPRTWTDGKPILFRRTYEHITDDGYEVTMEYSRDDGKTWVLGNRTYYERIG